MESTEHLQKNSASGGQPSPSNTAVKTEPTDASVNADKLDPSSKNFDPVLALNSPSFPGTRMKPYGSRVIVLFINLIFIHWYIYNLLLYFYSGFPEVDPLPSLKVFESFHADPAQYEEAEKERKLKSQLKKAAKLQEEKDKEAKLASQPQKVKNVVIRMASK